MTDAPLHTWSNGKELQGLNHKHLELMDLMIKEPQLTSGEMAARLGMSESWCSTLKHSDLFQEEFRKRLAAHRQLVSERIVQKVEVVVERTVDRMNKILENEDEEIGIGRLAQVFDITAKRLFPNERSGGTIVNIALADPDAIKKARERAEKLRTGSIMIDATAEPVSS